MENRDEQPRVRKVSSFHHEPVHETAKALLPHRDVALQPMDLQARWWRVSQSLPVQGFTKDRLEGS
ncbi:hypothetical protein AKJ53_01570 [candidate division MSBL1 archaeon SCGC-AAA382F02]|uniref:Uncharacterized protein n=1 Tax=candidate division MSBL1 archaeon SCGC-AAA382F02 TaxID=1698282 RepID=A0A133VHU3_9EURY|nr:hypothetical protein AKJ53_01570 [candidate division MSBL1 archaeon SCGC-AAA382F02]